MPNEIVITFGKFNPPHIGHHALVKEGVVDYANSLNLPHIVFSSSKHLKPTKSVIAHADAPLSPERKIIHLQRFFQTPNIQLKSDPYKAIEELISRGHSRIHVVLGSDRVDDTGPKLKEKYGDRVNIIQYGKKREAGAKGIQGASSTLMRSHSEKNDFDSFRELVPEHLPEEHARELFDDIRKGLKLAKININEDVSPLTRQKLARVARRTAKRRMLLRRARQRRRRNLKQLKRRAKGEVKDTLRRRLTGKKPWKKISYSQRAQYDKAISRKKKISDTMVKRIMPEVIRGESERLKKINSSFDPIIDNFFTNFLSEAKRKPGKDRTPTREPKTGTEKLKRRTDNRNNQRNTRANTDNEIKSGNVKGNVFVVRNQDGDLEIIDKKSLTKGHTIVVDAEQASTAKLQSFLNDADFVNTETSEKLFGFVNGSGGSKKSKKQPKEEKPKAKKSKPKENKGTVPGLQAPVQMIPAVKKASKKDTFATSHGATEMESGIVYALNSMLGLTPQQMLEKSLIDEETLNAVMRNPNESFLPSCQRAAQQILKQFGKVYIKHTGRLKKETKLNKEARDNGVTDKTPKSDLLLVDESGKVVATLSQKIGNSQLSSGGPAETITNLKWSMAQVADKLEPSAKKQIEKFIKFFEDELSGNPRTRKGPVSLYQKGSAREGEDEEVARRERLHDKATEMLNTVLNGDKNLAKAFVYSLLTGQSKFEEGSPSEATHIFSANRDGTDSKITPIDMDYCGKILDKVKFQMKFKSSAVETSDVKKKWEEFEERKKKLGEEVSAEDDFRQYAFRSVIRSYLIEENSFRKRLLKLIIENVEENKLKNVIAKEPTTPEEGLQYLKDAFEYIGDDAFKLIQFFEDSIDFDTTQPIIDWSEYADNSSTSTNTIYINGKKFEVPVEEPYNYDESGMMNSSLSEQFLEEKRKRNYRKEYDNYHSKPEQRKNRSKRVLARRLMMKLGRVRKGDGKDVDHKDSNPQNNGKHNLRVRNKSENRADNG
jgi:hypothetical protein